MEEVKVICPFCGQVIVYKNYWDWVLHSPCHWIGKRMSRCPKCRRFSYKARLKD